MDKFIGETVNTPKGGVLTVSGFVGINKHRVKVYEATCSLCNKDKELYPHKFLVTKGSFYRSCPCGCSKYPRLTTEQAELKIKRICEDKSYTFDSFVNGYTGNTSKFKYMCSLHGTQYTSYDSFVNRGSGCPSCYGNKKNTKEQASIVLKNLCDESGYKFIGFVGEYINSYSEFVYECPRHGKNTVLYYSFVNNGCRCPKCNGQGYQKDKPGTFYIVEWTNEKGVVWLKFGITGEENPESRMKKQAYEHKKNIGEILNYKIKFMKRWDDGSIAMSVENEFKNIQKEVGMFCDKNMMWDGYTETISIDSINLVEKYVKHLNLNNFVE